MLTAIIGQESEIVLALGFVFRALMYQGRELFACCQIQHG
jgi:hypothetical protein